ncbi:ATP-binding protein [Streptomyces sp. NPDC055709]
MSAMRRIAAARLRYCGLEALTDDVMLIVSELLTNAILHSRTTEIGLRMTVRDGFLCITVADGMPIRPEPRHVDENAESGRGLALVAALAKENGGDWGTSDEGRETWCSLSLAGAQR